MKRLIVFFRQLMAPPATILVEDLHIRLLNDWILQRNQSFIHPHCRWKLADGHIWQGVYEGRDFYDSYSQEVDSIYPVWYEVVHEVIGSPTGGIITGEYQFRRETSGLWYTAPFTHFYRIHQGQIVGVRYYMGDVSIHLELSPKPVDLSELFGLQSLN